MFAAIKMLFVYVALGSAAGIVGVPISFVTGDIGPLFRVAMWIMRVGVIAGGIRVEVTGLEHVPESRCIFMSNHVSNLDPPVLMPYLPGRCAVLLKRSLMKIPILGTAMRMAKFIPVERHRSMEGARASIAAAGEALQSGLNILVFPEGTRSRDGRLSTLKKGPFFLAQETNAPIVPIAISGTQHMMRKGSFAVLPGVARLEFLRAIEPQEFGTREELMDAVRTALALALPEAMRPVTDGFSAKSSAANPLRREG